MINPWREQSKVCPQRENGHRRVANDVFQALMVAQLSGAEFLVALCVIDRTWGYDLKEAIITFRQFTGSTQLSRSIVNAAIQGLEKRRVLVIERHPGRLGNAYLFNKFFGSCVTRS